MKKRLTKEGKNIVMASIGLFFSVILVVATSTAFAWFSNNTEAEATGTSVCITALDGVTVSDYFILKRSGGDEGATDVTDTGSIVMSEYDTVFTDRNVNTPIIIKVLFEQYPSDFSTFYLHISCEGNYLDSSKKLDDCLSNITHIGVSAGNSTIDNYDIATETESVYNDAVSLVSSSSSFVSYTGSGASSVLTKKEDSLSFPIEFDSSNIIDGQLAVYIKIDYNDDLVNKYLSQHEIDSTSTGSSDYIDFESDITSFQFDKKEEVTSNETV